MHGARGRVQVWHQNPKGSMHLFTVPEPFNLETDQREQRPTCYASQHQEAASTTSSQPLAKVGFGGCWMVSTCTVACMQACLMRWVARGAHTGWGQQRKEPGAAPAFGRQR